MLLESEKSRYKFENVAKGRADIELRGAHHRSPGAPKNSEHIRLMKLGNVHETQYI